MRILPFAVTIAAVIASVTWACAWVAARALVVAAPLRHVDAIVVMSGAPVYFGRTAHAGRLFLEGRANTILLTNDGVRGSWSNTLQRNPLYYERATLRLTQAGVPAAAIEVLPGRVSSTYEEAILVRDYAQAHHLKTLLVVTSDFHTRRALWTMRRVLRASPVQVGVEAAAPVFATFSPATWWSSWAGWRTVLGEYLKLIGYLVRY